MLKKLVLLALPVGAVAGPYVVQSGPKWVSQATASFSQGSAPQAQEGTVPGVSIERLAAMPLEGAEVDQFWEVLRFDLTPSFVAQRWPRVTTSLYELDLQGFRVPLVTGTDPDDLAGSLTYYFNQDRRLQRITFAGTTGDYRRLLYLLTTYYGFVNRPTNTPNVILFEVPSSETAASYLWVRPVDVLRADQPLNRFHLTLVLERPS
ncbi:MAG: hypothetical protein GXX96_33610 [Planctomycetaceae bacterium]|mgnify:CR=1 FL=1|nr:hypothetical protein [Planctomycetaceae bacterium]